MSYRIKAELTWEPALPDPSARRSPRGQTRFSGAAGGMQDISFIPPID
jgi:hypothetical protein